MAAFVTCGAVFKGERVVEDLDDAYPVRTDVDVTHASKFRPRARKRLTVSRWREVFNGEGRLLDMQSVLRRIQRGGVAPAIRAEVWEFLLGVFSTDSTHAQRRATRQQRREAYARLLAQCREVDPAIGSGEVVEFPRVREDGAPMTPETPAPAARLLHSDGLQNPSRPLDVASVILLGAEDSTSPVSWVEPRGVEAGSPGASGPTVVPALAALMRPARAPPPNTPNTPADAAFPNKETAERKHLQEALETGRGLEGAVREEADGAELVHTAGKGSLQHPEVRGGEEARPAGEGAEGGGSVEEAGRQGTGAQGEDPQRFAFLKTPSGPPPFLEMPQDPVQFERAKKWRWTLHQIGVDVLRTDRKLEFFQSRDNRARLMDLLAVYAWLDGELGYCQGMSDLMAPMVVLFRNDADAFWCFERLMRRVRSNFCGDKHRIGVQEQLDALRDVLLALDPSLYAHLEEVGAGSLFFVVRPFMALFRRELSFADSLYMLEMMWAAEFDEAHAAAESRFEPTLEGPRLRAEQAEGPPRTGRRWARGSFQQDAARHGGRRPPQERMVTFCVAALLEAQREALLGHAKGLDEVMKEFNDKMARLDPKLLCKQAVALHRRRLRALSS